MCRATKVGRSKDPSFCEMQAADFLQCYQEMSVYVKKNCATSYNQAFDCLAQADSKGSMSVSTSNISGSNKDTISTCRKAMDDIKLC